MILTKKNVHLSDNAVTKNTYISRYTKLKYCFSLDESFIILPSENTIITKIDPKQCIFTPIFYKEYVNRRYSKMFENLFNVFPFGIIYNDLLFNENMILQISEMNVKILMAILINKDSYKKYYLDNRDKPIISFNSENIKIVIDNSLDTLIFNALSKYLRNNNFKGDILLTNNIEKNIPKRIINKDYINFENSEITKKTEYLKKLLNFNQ